MSLQAQLDAFKAEFSTRRPLHVQDTMARATAALKASGQAEHALKAGDAAPVFTLTEADGGSVSSADLLARGPLVLSFYRGAWCPYCNMEMKALQAILPEIHAAKAELVAISPQTTVNGRKSKRDNVLDFPVLHDAGGAVAHAFGLRYKLLDELVALYKGFGNDLAIVNADPSWTLPMPGRYVVGMDGVIVYAEVDADYTRRPEPTDLLPVLERLGS